MVQDVKRRKRSEKGKKKSVSHSPNTKDQYGKKTPVSDEISTQFFEIDISQNVFCPSVNVEKSRGDDDALVTNKLEEVAGRLDEDLDLASLASNIDLAAKAEEAHKKLEKMKKEWEEEERKAREEERKAREEEEEEGRNKRESEKMNK